MIWPPCHRTLVFARFSGLHVSSGQVNPYTIMHPHYFHLHPGNLYTCLFILIGARASLLGVGMQMLQRRPSGGKEGSVNLGGSLGFRG